MAFSKRLKNLFIPNKRNNHKPHILRNFLFSISLLAILGLEVFMFTTVFVGKKSDMAAVITSVLVDMTENARTQNNVDRLILNPKLEQAAQMKADDMASKSYFSHTTPDGKRFTYFLDQSDYQYKNAGENLAITSFDSSDVMNAWMNSPTHKANIIKNSYKEFGIGVAQGMYEGRQTYFVAQYFGNPAIEEKIVAIDKTVSIRAEEPNKTAMLTMPGPKSVVLGEEAKSVEPSPMQKVNIPPSSVNYILEAIFLIFSISLILAVFIKIKIQHKEIIRNGLILVVIVASFLLFNSQLFVSKIDPEATQVQVNQ